MHQSHPLTVLISKSQYTKELRETPPNQQRQWAADMLRRIYEHNGQRPPVTGLRTDALVIGMRGKAGTIREYW
ncbi:MAG TPA: hypothetical protein VHY59_10830 [Chthoniobacterales bacterium]|nr:hypothetical protein [Chthoniobacterales bacterium]